MYEYIIWLEVHIKLNSINKLFCSCKNEQDFEDLKPNTHICPVCTWQPGALPVLNQEAFEKAVILGHILNCEVKNISSFDRKSYFYPDLPLGYQITQLYNPTNINWYVEFFTWNYSEVNKIRIERAHIESDAGKTTHSGWSAIVDYNRAGTPLVEIVTYPDFVSDEQVVEFLKELQRLVRYNNVAYADLEKWQMRCDVNLSIRKKWTKELGTKVELKNMSSFSAIKRAINNEFERQVEILESWKEIDQETRGWDDENTESYTMRSKEDSLDYRYFPEPDMPAVKVSDEYINWLKSKIVESIFSRVNKYINNYWFNKEYINALIQTESINNFFENSISQWIDPKLSAKWIVTNILWSLEDYDFSNLKFWVKEFVEFISLIQDNKLIDSHAKQVIKIMIQEWGMPSGIIEKYWFKAVDMSEIEWIVKEVLQENPQAVQDFKDWQWKAVWFLIWQVMQKSKWKADPKQVKPLIEKLIW